MWWKILCVLCVVHTVSPARAPRAADARLAADYFGLRGVRHAAYFSCGRQLQNLHLVKHFIGSDIRTSVKLVNQRSGDVERFLRQWNIPIGVLLDGSCELAQLVLDKASQTRLFDGTHMWVVLAGSERVNDPTTYIHDKFRHLNLSVDADIAVVSYDGLNISLEGFKYYNRWDFHNLTFRAVTVVSGVEVLPKQLPPGTLTDPRHTPGIAVMTKVAAQLMEVLMEHHNFRFNYTILGRWIQAPTPNSTLAVTNTLHWRQYDIACTGMRMDPQRVQWVDPFFPPISIIETKFYYLVTDRGVGAYENRFLRPLSRGVWWGACAAGCACALVLCAAAAAERRPQPPLYALCVVLAAACQQAYEDGVQLMKGALSSQGRRAAMLVLGLTSMLLYDYYTSSVVSWLLKAAAPSIPTIEELAKSDLELIFEDNGYTRGWLDNPSVYYYRGYKNQAEDVLRERKVRRARRTVPLLQTAEDGVNLMRTGAYAYHSEPPLVSQEIARLSERELCELASLQMMAAAPVYMVGQPHSPYRQFFVWSLMRQLERGHVHAARWRVRGVVPTCSGRVPRALALGQAAPAFALLALGALLAAAALLAEILWHNAGARKHRLCPGRTMTQEERQNNFGLHDVPRYAQGSEASTDRRRRR